jgi:hypothetical protein
MLAKQVLQELNAGGRVSKETQLAVDDAARDADLLRQTRGTKGDSSAEVGAPCAAPARGAGPSLWQRVLEFLGLGGSKDKGDSGVDRSAQVQRLRELIQRLRTTDLADRLSVLRDIQVRKQELFGDLFAMTSHRPALELVGQQLLEMERVLASPHPEAGAVGVWDCLLAALEDLLLSLEREETASTGPRPKGFWK